MWFAQGMCMCHRLEDVFKAQAHLEGHLRLSATDGGLYWSPQSVWLSSRERGKENKIKEFSYLSSSNFHRFVVASVHTLNLVLTKWSMIHRSYDCAKKYWINIRGGERASYGLIGIYLWSQLLNLCTVQTYWGISCKILGQK